LGTAGLRLRGKPGDVQEYAQVCEEGKRAETSAFLLPMKKPAKGV
jgi:hypothetical protein